MKIQLDFSKKIITIEEDVNLKILFDKVETIIPDWKDWTLKTNTTIEWNTQIIERERPFWYPLTNRPACTLTATDTFDSEPMVISGGGIVQIEA